MHRVGAPQHLAPLALDGADQPWQVLTDLAGAHAHDEVEAPGVVGRVERIDQADQLFRVHARADLDPDRVVHPAQELHMCAIELAGAVADPQHVRRAVVVVAGQAVLAHEGFFVVQQQCLVGGEKAGFAQLRGAVQAAGAHEGQGLVDAVGQLVVFVGQRRIGDEVQVPLVHLVQVGETALGEGAQQVEAGGGLVVGLQQAVGVRYAAFFVEADTVDDVAAVGRQRDVADGFVTR
ncbi:hypothetical protein D3C78_1298710 [compost metagenome]